jgi:inner membrane protein involved in colicin E2 resistance
MGIVLVLMVVLSMIRGVVNERQGWRSAAFQNIAQSLATPACPHKPSS